MFQPHVPAAWRQPAGKQPCQRPANALASARTFGAKHSRGLPPSRSQMQPHGGSLRANGPANARTTPAPARAPSVRNTAGGCRPTARYRRMASTMTADNDTDQPYPAPWYLGATRRASANSAVAVLIQFRKIQVSMFDVPRHAAANHRPTRRRSGH